MDLVFVLTGCTSHPAYAHLIRAGAASGGSSAPSGPSAAAGEEGSGDEDRDVLRAAAQPLSAAVPAAAPPTLVLASPVARMAVYSRLLAAMPEEQVRQRMAACAHCVC